MSPFKNNNGGGKPWVTYGVVAVVLLVGGYFVRAAWHKGDKPEDAKLLCVECGYTSSRTLEIGEASPIKCPKCGKQSLYPAIKCPKCGAPNVWNADRGIPGVTKCKKCGAEIHRGN